MTTTTLDPFDETWQRLAAQKRSEDLWPVDQSALAAARRRYRRGRPVRVVGWFGILALSAGAVLMARTAAPRDAMLQWGTLGALTTSRTALVPTSIVTPQASPPPADSPRPPEPTVASVDARPPAALQNVAVAPAAPAFVAGAPPRPAARSSAAGRSTPVMERHETVALEQHDTPYDESPTRQAPATPPVYEPPEL